MKNKFVEVYRLQNDGTQQLVVTCRLSDGMVQCEGEQTLVKQLEGKGIADYASDQPKKLFPRDGLAFLRNLKYSFKSGYLNASDVHEEM